MNPHVPEKDSLRLKHYFQVGIGLGLFVALVSGAFWLRSGPSKTAPEEVTEALEGAEELGGEAPLEEALAADQETPGPNPEPKGPMDVDINKASEFFGQSLKPMAACLSLYQVPQGERIEPTFDNLAAALKADLGEPILNSEDWISWSLRVDSEERRIRIETDYSDTEQAMRHLMYFKIDAQGQPAMIPLSPENTKNPSEAFVSSLQKDGEVYQEEKGRRAYFENGQELVLTEKNGRIDDLEFSNGAKTFRCGGLLSASPRCKCY